jgi:outer membrane protein TolC
MRRTKKIVVGILFGIIAFPAFSQQVLTLEKCKELALKNNIQVKNAALSVEIAEQQKKEAFTKYFPSVSATGFGFTTNKPMMSIEVDMSAMIQPMMTAVTPLVVWMMQQGMPLDLTALGNLSQPIKIEALKNGIVGGVMATQPVFAGGQIINGNRLARAGAEIRQLQKQMTDDEVLLETERYFWQLVSMKEKIKTIENSETMLVRISSDVKIAVEAGLTTRNDLLRMELEQNKLESDKRKAENGLQMLKMSLGQKIGVPADDFDITLSLTFSEGEEITPPLLDGSEEKLEARSEYKFLEKSVEVARLQHNMEIGKNLPTVAVGVGYNYMNFDMDKDVGMKNDFGMAFATVSIPITDWWGGSHAVKRKKLELQQAEHAKKENAELLLQQMQNIRNGLNEAYHQILLAKKSISSAEENLKINEDNYNAGVTTLSDLLEAQNLLQQSRDLHTEAATTYFVKLAEYRQVTRK